MRKMTRTSMKKMKIRKIKMMRTTTTKRREIDSTARESRSRQTPGRRAKATQLWTISRGLASRSSKLNQRPIILPLPRSSRIPHLSRVR